MSRIIFHFNNQLSIEHTESDEGIDIIIKAIQNTRDSDFAIFPRRGDRSITINIRNICWIEVVHNDMPKQYDAKKHEPIAQSLWEKEEVNKFKP
jgi:hypothetical protein